MKLKNFFLLFVLIATNNLSGHDWGNNFGNFPWHTPHSSSYSGHQHHNQLWDQLALAMVQGLASVKSLVPHKIAINAFNTEGNTPLHLACKYADLKIVQFLLSLRANVHAKNNQGETPLYLCSCYNGFGPVYQSLTYAKITGPRYKQIIELLLSKKANINVKRHQDGFTMLHNAVGCGNTFLVKLLLSKGADPTIRDKSGRTPRSLAFTCGQTAIASILTNYKNINTKQSTTSKIQNPNTQQSRNPYNNDYYRDLDTIYKDTINKLKQIRFGRQHNPNSIQSPPQSTTSQTTQYNKQKQPRTTYPSRNYHQPVQQKNTNTNRSQLFPTFSNNLVNEINKCEQQRKKLDKQDNQGNTFLHRAVKENNTQAIKLLLQKAPNIRFIRNKNGETALSIAKKTKNTSLISLLQIHKLNPQPITFTDIIGLEKTKQELKKRIKLFKTEKNELDELGVTRPKGIILYGPPGTGKTMLAQALAHHSNFSFMEIKTSEIGNQYQNTSQVHLRKKFEDARKKGKQENKPVLLFIDEIDAIAKNRNTYSGSSNQDRFNAVNAFLQELNKDDNIFVVGATNNMDIIDPAIAQRLKTIDVPLPTRPERKELIKEFLYTKRRAQYSNNFIEKMTVATKLFSARNIAKLINNAAIKALEKTELLSESHLSQAWNDEHKKVNSFLKPKFGVLTIVKLLTHQSLKREKQITLDDLVLNQQTKKTIRSIIFFIQQPMDLLKRVKISKFRSKLMRDALLLEGPPGTGKTTIAKAIANESHCNFYEAPTSITSPNQITYIFDKAREVAPCIVFFDEIDSFAKKRSINPYASVVNQSLTQMEGFSKLEGDFSSNESVRDSLVVVIGSTNFRQSLDRAVLSRFNKNIIHIPLPNEQQRIQIIKKLLKAITNPHTSIKMENFFKWLTQNTKNFSGRDLNNLVTKAITQSYMDNTTCVTKKHFETVIQTLKRR